jgi:alkanesulfonate monooxygenase SsuD/methylene tetrahydromethanopterin reductase-like flavin-dependent oxidoreductase (luciferase family)
VSPTAAEARAFGRKDPADDEELWAEAADVVEVARRLWDSWEDGAIIRDASTGRFVDRNRLHYIDFESERFSVRGPSITPRSPQAQPPILVELGAGSPPAAWRLAAREADLVVLRGERPEAVGGLRATLDHHLATEPRTGPVPAPLVLGALGILLDTAAEPAAARRRALDADAPSASGPGPSEASHQGTGAALVETFDRWRTAFDLDGFLLRPAVGPIDLAAFAATVTPLLTPPPPAGPPAGPQTLRDRFGWPRPANRYAPAP